MPKKKERVGFIFECGRGGPDYKVCSHFLARLNSDIDLVPEFLDVKTRLLNECGTVAARLLDTEACVRVIVSWDLEPKWGGVPCRHDDKELAFKSLRDAGVPLDRVHLLCIERELECWLMADKRALTTVIAKLKRPHPVGRMPDYGSPDDEIGRPKTELINLFKAEKLRKYADRDHALHLAKAVPDWSKLRRSRSFRRFAEKAASVTLP